MISFLLGRCQIKLGFSWFALLAFCCLFAGIGGGVFFLLAILLHEGAHVTAMYLLHAPPSSVELSALGCRILLDPRRKLGYRESILVSLAGPAANLLSFLAAFLIGQAENAFSFASLALGILHSLPIEPLDGGLALKAFLSLWMDEAWAGKISRILSFFLLFPLAVFGFFVLLRTRYNFSLLALSVYLMLYLVLKQDFSEP